MPVTRQTGRQSDSRIAQGTGLSQAYKYLGPSYSTISLPFAFTTPQNHHPIRERNIKSPLIGTHSRVSIKPICSCGFPWPSPAMRYQNVISTAPLNVLNLILPDLLPAAEDDNTFSRASVFGVVLTLSFCLLTQPSGSLLYKKPSSVFGRVVFFFWRLNPLACAAEALLAIYLLACMTLEAVGEATSHRPIRAEKSKWKGGGTKPPPLQPTLATWHILIDLDSDVEHFQRVLQ
jgi:hypothetical protein